MQKFLVVQLVQRGQLWKFSDSHLSRVDEIGDLLADLSRLFEVLDSRRLPAMVQFRYLSPLPLQLS